MKFIKNHLYKDIRSNAIIVFDNYDENTDIYYFTDIDDYFPRLYFRNEVEYLKEY